MWSPWQPPDGARQPDFVASHHEPMALTRSHASHGNENAGLRGGVARGVVHLPFSVHVSGDPPMKPRLLAVFLLVASLANSARAQDDEERLKKRFLSECPDAIKAWQAQCSKVEGVIRQTSDDPGRKTTPRTESLFSFKCNLPEMVLTSISTDPNGQREEAVGGINKDYSFSLTKRGSASDFALRSLEPTSGSQRAARNSPANSIKPILWVPYAAMSLSPKFLAEPRFAVRRISTVTRDDRSLLRVEFDLPGGPLTDAQKKTASDPGRLEGYFLFSPDEKWVLYEYECRETRVGRRQGLYRGTVEYQGTANGFPIPRRAARQVLKLPGGDVLEAHTFDFLEFRFVDVPHSEFTVSAFGVPEAVSQPAKPANSGRSGYWLLALAAVTLAAAVFFKVAASRRVATSQP